jgi:hypothetical protein
MDERLTADRSIEEIEGDVWGDPPPDATDLVATVHRLRRKPVRALTAEDLRVLMAQRVGLDAVVPSALERLADDPLLEGDFYPGDVLVAALNVPPTYWSGHSDRLARLDAVVASVEGPDADLARDIDAFRERTRTIPR